MTLAVSPQFRTFRLGDRQATLEGVSTTDVYFSSMGDGVEDVFFNFCKKHLSSTDVAVDIGANIGVTSLLMSQCLSEGHVYAIEPARTVFATLQRNVLANSAENISVYDIAISERVGTTYFHDESAYGHMVTNEENGHPVKTSSLDSFVSSRKISKVDFVKIDVEGFEQSVLTGAEQSMSRYAPLVYMEFNSWCLTVHSRTNPLSFIEWLFERFEHIYVVDQSQNGQLRKIFREGALGFLQKNMFDSGFVDDLVMTNDLSRIAIS